MWTSRGAGVPHYLTDQGLSMAEDDLTDPGHARLPHLRTLGLVMAVVNAARQQRRVNACDVTQ